MPTSPRTRPDLCQARIVRGTVRIRARPRRSSRHRPRRSCRARRSCGSGRRAAGRSGARCGRGPRTGAPGDAHPSGPPRLHDFLCSCPCPSSRASPVQRRLGVDVYRHALGRRARRSQRLRSVRLSGRQDRREELLPQEPPARRRRKALKPSAPGTATTPEPAFERTPASALRLLVSGSSAPAGARVGRTIPTTVSTEVRPC